MKKVMFISIMILIFLTLQNTFAENNIEENLFVGEGEVNILGKNYVQTPYTPSIVYDSGYIPFSYNQCKTLVHDLNFFPIKIDILFKDSEGRITGWNTGYKARNGNWRGIRWDGTYCDNMECRIQLSGGLGTSAYGGFHFIRVLLWQ